MAAVIQHSSQQPLPSGPLPAGDGAARFVFDGEGATARAQFAAHVRALATGTHEA